jgi:5-hydroxyisourate hydrolase
MSAITTHVLDTALGRPAVGIDVQLDHQEEGEDWTSMARGVTDADGRLRTLLQPDTPLAAGTYRLVFNTGAYFARSGATTFYPHVIVVFHVTNSAEHHHVPLLLSPFGYSTYRGS